MTQPHPPIAARAFIFDVDGTLVDTVDKHAEAWHRAFAHFGYRFRLDDIRGQIGKGGDQLMPVFLPGDVVETRGKEIESFRSDLFKRDYLAGVQGFPDVRALFEMLRHRGFRIALASSAKADELESYKRAADIVGLTDAETSSDDAEKSKPHPDIFEAALRKLAVAASDALVIGDTPYDAQAATRAGIASIGVLCGGFAADDIRAAGAFDIYADVTDILRNAQITS